MGRREALALLRDGVVPERYEKNIGTVGIAGQIRLLEAKVAIAGAGGLGGLLIELLARQGVGCLRIIDGDCFTAGNLNRQLLATGETIGMSKAAAAVERVRSINADVEAEAVPVMLDDDNALALLRDMDVAADALDSLNGRRLLARTAANLRVPLVHAAIAGFSGLVTTLLPGGPGLDCLHRFSRLDRGIEAVAGNPAATPALAASIQAQEVVKLITGTGRPLAGKLLYFDTEVNSYKIISL